MFGSDFLEYEVRDGAAWLTINRPKYRNAMSFEMYRGLRRAVEAGDADPEVYVTVITGVDDTFCVGGGLTAEVLLENPGDWPGLDYLPTRDGKQRKPVEGTPVDAVAEIHPFAAIAQCRKTVISLVNGLCIGGGFVIAMASDLVLASDRATFRVPELLRGVPDQYVAGYLPAIVGLERAKYIMFTAQKFTAAQALAWGFVCEVAEHETLGQRAEELIDLIVQGAPRGRMVYKAHANRYFQPADPAIMAMASAEEKAEGARAFAEKRPPSWIPAARAHRISGRL